MAVQSLKEKIASYEEAANYKLLSRVPIVIHINGRSFSKITSILNKPYCNKFADVMTSTMLQLCLEVEGTVLGYQFNDEIIIVARNDQNNETVPWYDNKVQKISSVASSIATLHFNNLSHAIDLNLVGDPIFLTHTYAVPSTLEALQVIISKQQQNLQYSVNQACLYELLKKYDKNAIKEMMFGLSADDKVDLLSQECNIDFASYPLPFRRGVACYRSPKIINDIVKNKWIINKELPIFTQDHSFLINIIKQGVDILRKDNV